jgi:hypothetical protein
MNRTPYHKRRRQIVREQTEAEKAARLEASKPKNELACGCGREFKMKAHLVNHQRACKEK